MTLVEREDPARAELLHNDGRGTARQKANS